MDVSALLWQHYFSITLRELNLYDSELIMFDPPHLRSVFSKKEWKDVKRSRETLHCFLLMVASQAKDIRREMWWFHMSERLKCLIFLDSWLYREKQDEHEKKELSQHSKTEKVPLFVPFISLILSHMSPPKTAFEADATAPGQQNSLLARYEQAFNAARDDDTRSLDGMSKYYKLQD